MSSSSSLNRTLYLTSTLLYCAAFPLFILAALALTRLVEFPAIPRYEVLFLLCLSYQVAMLATGIETPREFATIFVFHALGVTMEIVKVNNGGWTYPEPSWVKLWGVPLYSGFMYASVGSFLLACWKRFDLRIDSFPPWPVAAALALAIYANFISNVWLPDVKPALLAGTLLLFWRTRLTARFDNDRLTLRIRLIVLFPILGPLIWLAENWGTYFGSWQYPRQKVFWATVPPDKLLSWTVLVVVSFLLVAAVRRETITQVTPMAEARVPVADDR